MRDLALPEAPASPCNLHTPPGNSSPCVCPWGRGPPSPHPAALPRGRGAWCLNPGGQSGSARCRQHGVRLEAPGQELPQESLQRGHRCSPGAPGHVDAPLPPGLWSCPHMVLSFSGTGLAGSPPRHLFLTGPIIATPPSFQTRSPPERPARARGSGATGQRGSQVLWSHWRLVSLVVGRELRQGRCPARRRVAPSPRQGQLSSQNEGVWPAEGLEGQAAVLAPPGARDTWTWYSRM